MIFAVSAAALLLAGCDKGADSFSLLSESAGFKQSVAYEQRKIDILWVIDNSGSMKTSQQALADNFQSFISRFAQLGLDFRMGVITTDAYLAYHYKNNARSQLKDRGRVNTQNGLNCNYEVDANTGVRIMDNTTPNLSQVFMTNIKQGVCGNGDERAFSSFEHALSNPLNADFRRPGAFLSIIIVSDEDDFSHYDWKNGTSSYVFDENYNNQFPISRFTDFLNTLTGTAAGSVIRDSSVSVISVLDNACANKLNTDGFDRKIGKRYMQLADATGGTKGSLCGDFGSTLQLISGQVIELSSTYKLDREPIVESIVITVNGDVVPQNATSGWTYEASSWTIKFHGTGIPPAGANVRIFFDPKNVKI